jgi:putative ABC transport system permease protein
MTTLLQDLRYGIRMLLKTPVVSGVAMLSLALGIAATASIFAVLDGFLLEPLPFGEPDELVLFREGPVGASVEMLGGASMGSFRDYEASARTLSEAMAYTLEAANLTGLEIPEQLSVVVGTPNLFDVLQIQPALGRGFRAEEGVEGQGQVLVLEHGFWERRFQGDPSILGRTLTLDGTTYTVVGVTPESFDMIPANVDAFRPTDFAAARDDYESRGWISFGRLAPGATLEQLEAEVGATWTRIQELHPDATRGIAPRVIAGREFFPGPTDTMLVMILTVVTLAGLLIACVNVANLLLSRAEERQKEVAVRTALGAGRGRILRQLLTESVTLGTLAGVLGVGLAVFVVRWLQTAMPVQMPRALWPELDPGVVAATVAISMVAGIAFGLMPALHAARGELREALGEGSRGGTASRARKRLRNVFVISECAVALGLLTGAGFLTEAFNSLLAQDPGYRQEGLLTFNMVAPEDRYPTPETLRSYQEELQVALGAVPGVEEVGLMSALPRGNTGTPSRSYAVEGYTLPEDADPPRAVYQAVNPGYFPAMEIELLEGRLFQEVDREDGPPVVVVSQAFVVREFPDGEALGERIRVGDEEEYRSIVGVVENTAQQRIALAGQSGQAFFVPAAQAPSRSMSFALRVPGEPTDAIADVRAAVWSVNPDQPLARIQTLDAFVAESLAGPRTISLFLMVMGGIALLLAAMGIYGVMAHAVAQQQREIGIRMALGADRGAVVGMVARSGFALVGTGLLLGIPLSFVMYRLVSRALGLFEGGLGLTYAGAVTAALLLVAAVSTLLPARRASGVQPVAALKDG